MNFLYYCILANNPCHVREYTVGIKLEEEQHGGTSRVKKKEGKITGKSTCQRSKKTPKEVIDVR